jgi:small-conductance mechanosensitive channel
MGRRVLAAVFAAAAMASIFGASLEAQPAAPVDTASVATAEDAAAGFPVVLGPYEVFRIRAMIKGRTAAERAEALSRRLVRFAGDRTFIPESIAVAETDVSSDVVAGEITILSTWDEDTVGTGMSRPQLAQSRADLLRAAVVRHRTEHSARAFGFAVLWTVLATAGLVVALVLLIRLAGWLRRTAQAWCDAQQEALRKKSLALLQAERVAAFVAGGLNLAQTLAVAALLYVYAGLVLGFFPDTRHLSARLATFVLGPIHTLVTGFINYLPSLIFLAILTWGTIQLFKLIRLVFLEMEAGRIKIRGFYPEWAMPTYRIVRIMIIALVTVVGYPYIPGSSTDAFKGISIFIGVLVSLGSSSIVSNIIAGVVITYMRSFRIGDVIQVGEHFGRVVETTMFLTRIRTPKNVEINVPNSVILGSNVVNYSAQAASGGVILHSEVTIGYQWPWRQVHALLLRAAERTEGIMKDPKPFVLQRSLGDFGVFYQINGHTDQPHRMTQIYSQLHKNIQDEFNEFGVEIMTPAYEGDRSELTITPKDRWYTSPAKQPGDPGADE